MNKEVIFQDWGLMAYEEAWQKQEFLFSKVVQQKMENRALQLDRPTSNFLIFVEHPHVYTLGKTGKPENLLLNEQDLERLESSYHRINRGGDITYHGPGQLVGYPILDLDNFFTDIHRYLRTLETAIIHTLADFEIRAGSYPGYTGVWLDADQPEKARKICAMGVHCSRWVTMHGFALNVNTDLNLFKHIIPCGINDKLVTSMQQELGKEIDLNQVKTTLRSHLVDLFEMQLVL